MVGRVLGCGSVVGVLLRGKGTAAIRRGVVGWAGPQSRSAALRGVEGWVLGCGWGVLRLLYLSRRGPA
jgi:hypothetical protein